MAANGELKVILWDLDGTILDSRKQHFTSTKQAFEEFGLIFHRENPKKHFGKTTAQILREMAGDKLSIEKLKHLEHRRDEIYRSIISKEAKFLPGVEQALVQFQAMGLKQVIASSTAYKNIAIILKTLDASHFFDQLFSGAEIPSKPDPAIFNLASEELGVDPKCCLVIEDSPFGVSAAKSAGMHCLAITNTNNAEDLGHADIVISTLTEFKIEDVLVLYK